MLNRMKAITSYLSLTLVILPLILFGCRDDKFDFWNGEYPEGETIIQMQLDFTPFSESNDNGTRSVAGKTMDVLDDLCVIAYDIDGNLVDGFPLEITEEQGLTVKDLPREDSDASNGHKAENFTKHGSFNLTLPFGRYYMYAVANLGSRDDKGYILTSTYQELTEGELSEVVKKREDLLNYPTKWDEDNPYNNFEMLGFFSNSKDSNSPSTGESTNDRTVQINSPGLTLHSWLRRCASKVTIDFDGSDLRENIKVYIRKATIHDIPNTCLLGMPNKPSDREKDLLSYKNSDYSGEYRPTGKGDCIIYGEGEDYSSWPKVSSGAPKIKDDAGKEIDFHNENAESMFLYENMQGDSEEERNKEQQPADDGTVVGATEEKDLMPCGSYIEVEGYYEYISSNQVEKGKIIYRFMLGKDALKNFDVERNHHIKLTMKLRGNGNDVDWHIEYTNDNGFEVKDPYYVSYLYNHDSTIHFRYTPPKGYTVKKMTAEIVGNNWWPNSKDYALPEAINEQNPFATSNDETNWKNYAFDHNKYESGEMAGKTKYLGNGFLSLRETTELNLDGKDLVDGFDPYNWSGAADPDGSNKYMNDRYFYGVQGPSGKRLIDRSKRTYYFDGSGEEDPGDNNTGREAYSVEKYEDGSMRFSIPMFTRAKNLVKQSAYSGNNPYEGEYRTAYVRLTAEIYNEQENKTDYKSEIVRVLQVPRVTNPKGIYRRSKNNENFHVILLERESTTGEKFNAIESDGPWMAEVIGDPNFINLNGRQTIKGSTGSNIDFNVRFNKMNRDNTIRNAVIRIRYHNYTCVHLIFVRQGYDAQGLSDETTKWHVRNLIYGDLEADDPRDEGSLFRFGNLAQPIDVKSNAPFDAMGNKFTIPDALWIAKDDGTEPKEETEQKYWKDISASISKPSDDWNKSKIATMDDFQKLFKTENVSHAFGALYADGATEVQTTASGAFGYNRHDEDKTKGMRGLFVYYWNSSVESEYNCRNVFFPIGRSGFGHRRSWDADPSGKTNAQKGVLRYAVGRNGEMPISASPWMPIFYDLYRREGAIYWAHTPKTTISVTEESILDAIALDINYYTFDVNCLPRTNLQKHSQWSGCTDNECIDACFLRGVN